jgi:hypothetical protein
MYDLATVEYEQATLGNRWGAKQKGNPFLFEESGKVIYLVARTYSRCGMFIFLMAQT